jgi:hypothetical protein
VLGVVTAAVVILVDVDTTFLLSILGVVVALTGIVHLLGGFELADHTGAGEQFHLTESPRRRQA